MEYTITIKLKLSKEYKNAIVSSIITEAIEKTDFSPVSDLKEIPQDVKVTVKWLESTLKKCL